MICIQVCRRFCKDQDRANAWFQHFSDNGLRHFEKGARALANFALKHRTGVWHLLCWTRRSWPPTVVANRPGHFSELDVPSTVQAFLHDCPQFFDSPEFQQACEDPQWISSSPGFFTAVCVHTTTCAFTIVLAFLTGQQSHTHNSAGLNRESVPPVPTTLAQAVFVGAKQTLAFRETAKTCCYTLPPARATGARAATPHSASVGSSGPI